MTFTFGKSLMACVAFSTLFIAGTAHAGNAFNKFPTATHTSAQKTVKVSTYRVERQPVAGVRMAPVKIKRVVKPAITTLASVNAVQGVQKSHCFNKMKTLKTMPDSPMPVMFSHNVRTTR